MNTNFLLFYIFVSLTIIKTNCTVSIPAGTQGYLKRNAEFQGFFVSLDWSVGIVHKKGCKIDK